MKANTIERILADQIFKISPSDENIQQFLIDCENDKKIEL